MIPAVFSRTYPLTTAAESLKAARADGFAAVQFNLSNLGLAPLPEALPPDLEEVPALAARAGVALAALSGTWNMAHPDPAHRALMRPRFRLVLQAARRMGVGVVTLCTGSRDAADMWRAHPDNATPEAWADLRAELAWALDEAAGLGLALGIEPEPANVICDAPAARRILNEMQAPHLGIVLDAANLIPAREAARQAQILGPALELLGGDLLLAHAKDHDARGVVVVPGAGVIDLPGFVAGLRGAGYDGPLIGHGFTAAEAGRAGRVLQELCAR